MTSTAFSSARATPRTLALREQTAPSRTYSPLYRRANNELTQSSSDINFTGSKTTVTTTGSYPVVGVDCGHCTGTWDWSELDASGGEDSDLVLSGGVEVRAFSKERKQLSDRAQISGGTY